MAQFLVPRDQQGVSVRQLPRYDLGRVFGDVGYSEVRVPGEALLGALVSGPPTPVAADPGIVLFDVPSTGGLFALTFITGGRTAISGSRTRVETEWSTALA